MRRVPDSEVKLIQSFLVISVYAVAKNLKHDLPGTGVQQILITQPSLWQSSNFYLGLMYEQINKTITIPLDVPKMDF